MKSMNELMTQYYLQDLKCKRTNQVHSRRLCNHSVYGGNLVLSKSKEHFQQTLKDLRVVAEFYDFKLVTFQLSWLGNYSWINSNVHSFCILQSWIWIKRYNHNSLFHHAIWVKWLCLDSSSSNFHWLLISLSTPTIFCFKTYCAAKIEFDVRTRLGILLANSASKFLLTFVCLKSTKRDNN